MEWIRDFKKEEFLKDNLRKRATAAQLAKVRVQSFDYLFDRYTLVSSNVLDRRPKISLKVTSLDKGLRTPVIELASFEDWEFSELYAKALLTDKRDFRPLLDLSSGSKTFVIGKGAIATLSRSHKQVFVEYGSKHSKAPTPLLASIENSKYDYEAAIRASLSALADYVKSKTSVKLFGESQCQLA